MLFEYGSRDSDGSSFGLAASDAEGNVTMKLSGSYDTVVEIHGNSSYPIDWDYWHHYCLTYDGSDITLYFDGVSEATATAPLDTMARDSSFFVGMGTSASIGTSATSAVQQQPPSRTIR